MRWLRSWPQAIPPHRAHVVDDMERLIISGYDYSSLASIDDDVLLCEWDMALSAADRQIMAYQARLHDTSVLVAPYLLYEPGPAHWAHRRQRGYGESPRWVQTDEPTCDLFGFGLIYLPRVIVRDFCAEVGGRLDDETFPAWYARRYGPARIEWSARPVHLHY